MPPWVPRIELKVTRQISELFIAITVNLVSSQGGLFVTKGETAAEDRPWGNGNSGTPRASLSAPPTSTKSLASFRGPYTSQAAREEADKRGFQGDPGSLEDLHAHLLKTGALGTSLG